MIRISLISSALVMFLSGGLQAGSPADTEAFEKEIRPLLIENCGKCHGSEKQKGGLRLDSRKALLEGGLTGPSIEPGRPEESLLIEAVRQTGDLKMPPNRKLNPEQVAALERWIASGAPWPVDTSTTMNRDDRARRSHWAFQPVGRFEPLQVGRADGSGNPIDAFLMDRLDKAGLAPSPPADRRTLIRRVSYDLTGLPPTPEEVEAFVNDPAPDAYLRLVERLLASEHYGEQWARHWLDVARYSDTKGYVYAREERFFVQAPAYRDWVVAAFNRDLPYDRFLLDQVAADQAEPDDRSAVAAMGFLTLGRRFLGVTHDIIDDRIDVVTRGTMGLTVACARCHDHKYDPIPTADYYSLYGVFQNSTERLVPVADPDPQDEKTRASAEELARRREKLETSLASSREEASERVRGRVADYLLAQRHLQDFPEEGFDVILSKADLIPAFVRRWHAYLTRRAKEDDSIFRPWRKFASLSDAEFAARSADVTRELGSNGAGPVNPRVARLFVEPPASIREVAERYGKLFAEVAALWSEHREGLGLSGLADPDEEELRRVLFGFRSPCEVPDEAIVSTESFFDTATIEATWGLQKAVDRWLIDSPEAAPHAVAVVDRAEVREPRIFRRGSPANQGDEVPRRFLAAISGPDREPFSQGSGRLELARAIVDPANPLTARVWVNRVWMHHFGAGLVRTPSDFGLRAEPPSHPELLDWLAARLVSEGWSTKAIHRLILTSAAYQQRSDGPDDLEARERAVQIDPENRLLWRMNPRRLTFEESRDTLLSISGELDLRIGGRAEDLFEGSTTNVRRTLYGLVDRQFLPSVLRVFDFANPDLHVPSRSETTVPQQALFAMNHPFLANRARALVARISTEDADQAVRHLYRSVYQRDPTDSQVQAARAFLESSAEEPISRPAPETLDWSYGYGAVDAASGRVGDFQPLPHFNGSAWSGGPAWPDPKLGWVQLTAQGGHPGNDLQHAAIRRWTAPRRGRFAIQSTAKHEVEAGDGIRCWIVSSRQGVLKSGEVHNASLDLSVGSFEVEAGEILDFVVDIREGLNSDQYLWAPIVSEIVETTGGVKGPGVSPKWDAARDFTGPSTPPLSPREQLAQVLLMANELMFVD
ncbi:DUF1553 domain-containing protein [Tundrisphaera lichenicola]|uniref:DUF1553 domain-containing protein n=1 Tax=Tundrisphaera lichenicola TaxID=2029860 RepID=UPI003EC0638F